MRISEDSNAGERPHRADARRNYDRLVEEARGLFTEQGPAASLDEVARRAGVASGTLYRHFPTRQMLIEAVLRDRVEQLARLGQDLMETAEPFEALTTWLHAGIRHAATYRGLSAALMTAVLDDRSDPVARWHAEMFAVGEKLLTTAQHAGVVRPSVRATDVLKLVSAIAWAAGESGDDAEDQMDRLLEIMLVGLHPPERS